MRLFRIAFAVGIILITSASVAQRPAPKRFNSETPKPQIDAPDPHCKTVLDNQRVRALRLDLGPKESTRQEPHRHDYLLVSLGDTDLQLTGSNSIPLQLHDGEMQLVPGRWPHKVINNAEHPASILMIELKDGAKPNATICGLDKSSCRGSKFGKDFHGTYSQSVLFETEAVRLVRTELGPGGSIGEHSHAYDHVVIALTPLHLKFGDFEMTQPQSAVAWQSGGFEGIWNIDTQEQRFLLLELK